MLSRELEISNSSRFYSSIRSEDSDLTMKRILRHDDVELKHFSHMEWGKGFSFRSSMHQLRHILFNRRRSLQMARTD
jgi:hypothetical protein